MKDSSAYYHGLDARNFEIRLLDLQPGRWKEPLRGKLRRISLHHELSFQALSYTWGSPATGKKTIILNGSDAVSITNNLFVALRRLRERFSKRTIWVDALCINQDDLIERGQQVAIMGRIYNAADEVLVWLGEYSGARFSDLFTMRQPHTEYSENGTYALKLTKRGRRFALALDDAIASNEPKWHDRAWVVQEFAMARKVLLCFGPISWLYETGDIMSLVENSEESLKHLHAFYEKASQLHSLSIEWGLDRRNSISHAAMYVGSAVYLDQRDRVYSLLSLIDSREAQMITSDYQESCVSTFIRATFASIRVQKNCDIFELVSFKKPRLDNLPTWTVDFTMHQDNSYSRLDQMKHQSIVWEADASSRVSLENVELDIYNQHLQLKGIELDRVKMTMFLPASGESAPASTFAGCLAQFLESTVRGHAGRNDRTALSTTFEPKSHSINPEPVYSLLTLHTLVQVAFNLWDELMDYSGSSDHTTISSIREAFKGKTNGAGVYSAPGVQEHHLASIEAYMKYAAFVSEGCKSFATDRGLIGNAPATVTEDDLIVLIHGSKLPTILRQDGNVFRFRGFAYVHGFWHKKFMSMWQDRDEGDIRVYVLV